ncbi:MAG: ketoacyl-ACP synthase III [Alphaproteobacteria bacterium]|nr:ketoacyl-ACP synthase III [Alphaproteobacteria bacterium]
MYRSLICGVGAYLPERVVTNEELAKRVDTTNEWIVERTGIRQRCIAADDEVTSDLAVAAATQALQRAELDIGDIDLIVVATTTPDRTFPATAAEVQAKLGATSGAAFDVQAVCAGFVYGLAVADNFVRVGQSKHALVIGAETFSRILDWNDRNTCVLFGDGAGAVVIKAQKTNGDARQRGILSTHLHTDGRYRDLLEVNGGVSLNQQTGHVRMVGREVFRHAVEKLAKVVHEALEANNLTPADVDWLVPHQANKRIIDGTVRKLNLSPDNVVTTVDRHANTSAASIPLALSEAAHDGRIKQGDLVLIEAIGGGLSWGSSLIRW